MTYQQTLDYLYNTLPMFSRMGSAAFKKDLTNTRMLCEHLGNPQQNFKSIHVGGTNGKGSVSHMLAAVLQSSGKKTGLYTSPHLYDFRERIKINGELVGETFVVDFVKRIRPLAEELHPSFFEITVAMAFEYFVQQEVDMAIIEVGLGGKYDSTNIILPELSIITNIGYDHMNMLGNSLEEIAGEKAGIIKPGIPVVIGERDCSTEHVFIKTAEKNNTSIYFAEDLYENTSCDLETETIRINVAEKKSQTTQSFLLDLPGIYQRKNLCTVLCAMKVYNEIVFPPVSMAIIKQGLSRVKKITGLHGRWEIIQQNPQVVLEVAHNSNGIKEMLEHIKQISFNKLRFVIGMVKDKNIKDVLSQFPRNADYYFTRSSIPRALDENELKKTASSYGLIGNAYDNVNSALEKAIAHSSADDLVIVCGSIFLIAEVDKIIKPINL